MTALSETILERFQIRKTKAQKTAFIDFMKSQLPGLQVEQGGFAHSRNLVLGNPASAKVLLTAHYDTCAQLPFPNFITPQNIPLYIGFNLLVCIPFLLFFFLSDRALNALTNNSLLSVWTGYVLMMALMFFMFFGGKPNPHTANDNTSGVITLCELYLTMDEEIRKNTALIFFDNEENGLIGSSYFAKRHKKEDLKNKLVLNFDCVSDGDHLLFVFKKAANAQYREAMEAAFPASEGKIPHFTTSSKAIYPSDQANFPVSIAVAAMKHHKLIGLYMNRIHTKHDTVFDRRNIDLLCQGTLRFLKNLPEASR